MSAPARHQKTGRFTRQVPGDPLRLYDAVREVALEWSRTQPDPVDPALISQREWNRVKNVCTAGVPNANEVCRQLGGRSGPLPWRHVLDLALDDTRDNEAVHRALTGTPDDDTVDEERVFFSLRRVALELGQDWLSIPDYLAGYDKLVRGDRRRRHGRDAVEQQLLTVSQILHFVNHDWPRACLIAGLRTYGDAAPERERAVSSVEALVRLHRRTGGWASYHRLGKFAREHGFALEGRPRNRGWHDVVEEARQRIRREDGVEPPAYDGHTQATWEPPAEPLLEPGDMPAISRPSYERPELVLHVIDFLEQLAQGERASQHAWHVFARRTGAPSTMALRTGGGLRALVKEASRPGARQRAELELAAIRNPTPAQRQEQEERDLQARAGAPQAQELLRAIRERQGATVKELRVLVGWESNATVRVWLRPLRESGLVKPLRAATHGFEVRYVPAEDESRPLLENDPAAIRSATTPISRAIHAELVKLESAEALEIAERTGQNRNVVSRLLMKMLHTGFVQMDVRPNPRSKKGRTFVYTPTGRPLPDEPEGGRWSPARRRAFDAVVALGEAQPHEIAAHAGTTAGTLRHHLSELVRGGYLERERRSRPKGSGVVMLYRPTGKPAPVL